MQQEKSVLQERNNKLISDSLFKCQSLIKNKDYWNKDFKLPERSQLVTCSMGENTSHSYSYNDLKI